MKLLRKMARPRTRNLTLLAGLIALPVLSLATVPLAGLFNTSVDEAKALATLQSVLRSSNGQPSTSDLVDVEKQNAGSRAAALAGFLRGYLHHSRQEFDQAVDALDVTAIEAQTSLGDYALLYRSESNAALGRRGEALRDLGRLYSRHSDSIKGREARLRAAELATSLGDPAGALAAIEPLLAAGDPDAELRAAQVRESTGQADEALLLYRRIYYERPATRASARAEERLTALGSPPKENPRSFDEELARCNRIFESKQYWEAAEAFKSLMARFPEAEKLDRVSLYLGASLLNSNQPAQAVGHLSRVTDRQPALHAEALFHLAEGLRRSNRAAESATVVDRLLQNHPKTRHAEDALYKLASHLKTRGAASTRFGELLRRFPASAYAPEATYELGWQAYKSGNYAEASRLLQGHLERFSYPATRYIGEAAFWAGRSEEKLGRKPRALALYDLAVERYRYGYHGYVAGRRAAALRASNPQLKAEPPQPGSSLDRIRRNVLHVEQVVEKAGPNAQPGMARSDELVLIGLNDLALKELNEALSDIPDSPMLNLRLAQIYSGRGDRFQATLILRRGYPDIYSYSESELPREAWEIFFPLAEWETIKTEARRYGIDPFFAAGLIRQESVFNPSATSRVGARGLMQVMPQTGQLVSRRQGTGNIAPDDLYNPQLNIKLGMNYLAQMMGQFGKPEYAAAAYNAGPGRARRWIAERGSLDIEDWVEAIPFSETRGYVQGVIRYAANYRRFYKE